MVVRSELEQSGAHHRPGAQVERLFGLPARQATRFQFSLILAQASQIQLPEVDLHLRRDHLPGDSVDYGERGPQYLMSPDDLAQCTNQDASVNAAAQTQTERYMIGGVRRVQLMQVPEPLLRERDLHEFLTGNSANRQRHAAFGMQRCLNLLSETAERGVLKNGA